MRYKRCRKPIPPVELNFNSLSQLVYFIKEKLLDDYRLYSLDEVGFGSSCLERYSWVEKGKEY